MHAPSDDQRIRHTLRPGEERDEIPERTTARNARADRRCVRRHAWHEHDERRNQREDHQCDERRARVMELCRRNRLVHEIDRRKGNRNASEKRTAQLHDTKHVTQLKSVRRTTEDLPMGQRRYPECVTREGKPRLRSLEEVVALPRRSPLTAELQRALAAASRLHGLRSDLSPVPVRPTATITEAGAYRFRLRDPIDLRVSRIGGRSALGFLHELGHLLDHQIFYDRKTRSLASAMDPAFAAWRAAAALLDKRALPGGRGRQRYFQSAHEIWARCYAQTVLLRSGDSGLEGQLVKLQAEDDVHVWPAVQFEAVAVEVE